LRAAIEAGVDPAALVESVNAAQAERVAARAELDNVPVRTGLDRVDVYAMTDSFGDVQRVLRLAEPPELVDLYGALGLELIYHHDQRRWTCRFPLGIRPRVAAHVTFRAAVYDLYVHRWRKGAGGAQFRIRARRRDRRRAGRGPGS
jgi:hypothetical protein